MSKKNAFFGQGKPTTHSGGELVAAVSDMRDGIGEVVAHTHRMRVFKENSNSNSSAGKESVVKAHEIVTNLQQSVERILAPVTPRASAEASQTGHSGPGLGG